MTPLPSALIVAPVPPLNSRTQFAINSFSDSIPSGLAIRTDTTSSCAEVLRSDTKFEIRAAKSLAPPRPCTFSASVRTYSYRFTIANDQSRVRSQSCLGIPSSSQITCTGKGSAKSLTKSKEPNSVILTSISPMSPAQAPLTISSILPTPPRENIGANDRRMRVCAGGSESKSDSVLSQLKTSHSPSGCLSANTRPNFWLLNKSLAQLYRDTSHIESSSHQTKGGPARIFSYTGYGLLTKSREEVSNP